MRFRKSLPDEICIRIIWLSRGRCRFTNGGLICFVLLCARNGISVCRNWLGKMFSSSRKNGVKSHSEIRLVNQYIFVGEIPNFRNNWLGSISLNTFLFIMYTKLIHPSVYIPIGLQHLPWVWFRFTNYPFQVKSLTPKHPNQLSMPITPSPVYSRISQAHLASYHISTIVFVSLSLL